MTTRRAVLATVGAALAGGCVGMDSDSDGQPDGGYGEQYDFEISVVGDRHGPALEELFEMMAFASKSADEAGVDESEVLSGEYTAYTDDGDGHARVELAVEPTSSGAVPFADMVITAAIVSHYAATASNPPPGYDHIYTDLSGERLDAGSWTHDEAVEFYEDEALSEDDQ